MWWLKGITAPAAAGTLQDGEVGNLRRLGAPIVGLGFWSIARISLGSDEWQQTMDWLRTTPIDTHVLADPGHAWRFGMSVRVAAERDVYLEEVKDTAMSLYSRRVAAHVIERVRAIGDFSRLTTERVRTLDRRFDLDYLVTDAKMDLPVSYRNSRFTIYALRE